MEKTIEEVKAILGYNWIIKAYENKLLGEKSIRCAYYPISYDFTITYTKNGIEFSHSSYNGNLTENYFEFITKMQIVLKLILSK